MGRQTLILIQAAITHAPWKPERVARIPRLCEALDQPAPAPIIVADSAREGAWRTTRRAWHLASREADWTLVIQDDAILPPRHYLAACYAQLAAARHSPHDVGLITHYHYRKSAPQTATWYTTHDALSGVALLMRSDWACEWLAWCDELNWDRRAFDDARLGFWLLATNRVCWVSVPSLADHDTTIPSCIGGSATGGGRTCQRPIGDANPLTINWTLPETPTLIPVTPSFKKLYNRIAGACA